MSTPLPHRIHRLRWQARAPTPAAAFALRSVLREAIEPVLAAIAESLSAHAPDDREVHLPRLELSLRLYTIPGADALPAQVAAAADEALAGLALQQAPAQPATVPILGQAGLTTYLHSGSTNWPLAGLSDESLHALLAEASLAWASLGSVPPDIYSQSRTERLGGLSRWLALLPVAWRRHVVNAHAATTHQHPLSRALQSLLDATAHQDDGDSLHAQALWLAWTMESDTPTDDGHPPWQPVAHTWLAALFATRARESHWQAVLDLLVDTPPPRPAVSAPHVMQADDSSASRAKQVPTPTRRASAVPMPAEPVDAVFHFDQHPAALTAAGQLVPLAGLVLLHPYLPRLFEATGLVAAGHRGPLPDAALPRAAALLHWLATGAVALEFELPFVKLLLGHSPHTPLAHALPGLDSLDRAEAEALLASMLAHWQALRGTSADGLRAAFLHRRGHLRRQDEAWVLRVEPESFDMLLGLLPWSIGQVRLPWMPWPLLTEWGTP